MNRRDLLKSLAGMLSAAALPQAGKAQHCDAGVTELVDLRNKFGAKEHSELNLFDYPIAKSILDSAGKCVDPQLFPNGIPPLPKIVVMEWVDLEALNIPGLPTRGNRDIQDFRVCGPGTVRDNNGVFSDGLIVVSSKLLETLAGGRKDAGHSVGQQMLAAGIAKEWSKLIIAQNPHIQTQLLSADEVKELKGSKDPELHRQAMSNHLASELISNPTVMQLYVALREKIHQREIKADNAEMRKFIMASLDPSTLKMIAENAKEAEPAARKAAEKSANNPERAEKDIRKALDDKTMQKINDIRDEALGTLTPHAQMQVNALKKQNVANCQVR